MKILDLFAGIGGFSLAAHWMGWETLAFVEKERFCQQVLKKNFTNVPIYGDIKQFDGIQFKESVDIVCGGFPCQPFSTAGKRKGKDDDRYLWHEMLRVIRETQPAWVVGENVAGIVSMDNGRVLDEICTDLENEGYAVQPFIIPAAAKGAPHRRDRIWIVATDTKSAKRQCRSNSRERGTGFTNGDFDATSNASERRWGQAYQHYNIRGGEQNTYKRNSSTATHVNSKQNHATNTGGFYPKFSVPDWGKHWFEVATELCRVDDGLSIRVDRHRAKRLKALGNAIVPQVAFEIFKAINEVHNNC